MNEKELYTILSSLGKPVAYDHFKDTGGVSIPFILYRSTATTNLKADDKTYYKFYEYIIDLVTEIKDVDLEEELEDLLDENHLPYDKTEDYIEKENIYQIRYFI